MWHTVDDHLQHRAIGMRVYAVASNEGYRVLPGGLTRVAAEADAEVVSMQRGGASKDTWVLGERAPGGEQWRAQRTIGAHDLVRRDPYLPSRVVENLFWFGRYCERCDDSARWLRIVLARYVDGDDPLALLAAVELGETCACCRKRANCRSVRSQRCSAMTGHRACAPTCNACSGRRPRCVASCPARTGQALVELQREAMELEVKRRTLASCWISEPLPVMSLGGAVRVCPGRHDPRRRLALFDDGWRIERLQFLSSSAAFLRGVVFDQAGLEWLLELGNSSITDRSRHLAIAHPGADLLLLDEQNPTWCCSS